MSTDTDTSNSTFSIFSDNLQKTNLSLLNLKILCFNLGGFVNVSKFLVLCKTALFFKPSCNNLLFTGGWLPGVCVQM